MIFEITTVDATRFVLSWSVIITLEEATRRIVHAGGFWTDGCEFIPWHRVANLRLIEGSMSLPDAYTARRS